MPCLAGLAPHPDKVGYLDVCARHLSRSKMKRAIVPVPMGAKYSREVWDDLKRLQAKAESGGQDGDAIRAAGYRVKLAERLDEDDEKAQGQGKEKAALETLLSEMGYQKKEPKE